MANKVLASGSSAQEIGFVVSLIAVNSFGVIANIMVVAMFVRYRRRLLAKPKNLFLFSMSVADLCVGMSGIVGGILFHLLANGHTTMTVYKIGGLLPFFGSFFISIVSLGTLTADRLISIKYAVRYTVVMNRNKVNTLIVSTWISTTSLVIMLGVLFFTVSAWTELMVRALFLAILFVVSSVVLAVSNCYLYLTLRAIAKKKAGQNSVEIESLPLDSITTEQYNSTTPETNRNQNRRPSQPKNDAIQGIKPKKSRKKRKDAGNSMICIWMTVLFIVCWFPVSVYYTAWIITGRAPIGRAMLAFCLSLASFNSLGNPCLYFAKRLDFRMYLFKLLKMNPTSNADTDSSVTIP